MKCLILAGGLGERLWPLSRKDYPKQFIQIQKNHSVFQETVARNIPFCDEFIIVTGMEYQNIIENQMKAFQGTPYRCVFEGEPRKTTAAVLLSCMDLQPSEYVFVAAADHLIDTRAETVGDKKSYRDAILKAREYAAEGSIVLFGKKETEPDERYGYISGLSEDGSYNQFTAKPEAAFFMGLCGTVYRNLGMLLFENGALMAEARKHVPQIFTECRKAYEKRTVGGNFVYYPEEVLDTVTAVTIEKSIIEKTTAGKAVKAGFDWKEISSLEDISDTAYQREGVNVINECSNAMIINNAPRQAVVVNDLNDVLVVNTPDAVYVSRQGTSGKMKGIMRDHPELTPYGKHGTMHYRKWGFYEDLIETEDYRVRQVNLFEGKTISSHIHAHRSENWTIVKGCALVTLDGKTGRYNVKENVDVPAGTEHQISNVGSEPLVLIETATGEVHEGADMRFQKKQNLTEAELGLAIEPMVKLFPAFKDNLWGGTKLRDVYGKQCDYDIIAESWELSAHPAGPSVVASGKHKGLNFREYLDVIGKEALGWKCSPLQKFPILIKFIDARENLSVQVHPGDDYAMQNENEYGKNEMWYVCEAEPGAGLYVGFNRDVTAEEIERRIQDNTIMEVLNYFPTKAGDVFFIPAGTVHAIGAGNLICEIQQSSNTTYRLYDYDRKDKYGNTRELHVRKALDVLNFHKYVPKVPEATEEQSGLGSSVLCRCKYFETILHEADGTTEIPVDESKFRSLVCIRGKGTVNLNGTTMPLAAGESIFIPAQSGKISLTGTFSVVESHI